MTETRLRELYELALATRGSIDRGQCVSPEAILALVRREGPEAARSTTLDHVMACDACRREFDTLRAIELAGQEVEGRSASRRPLHASWRRVETLAIAAALLVAVGLGLRDRGRVAGADVSRSAEEGVTLVAPAAATTGGVPLVFVWRADPGASRYLFELLDAEGRVVVSERTADTTLTLRDSSRLVPGADYGWWVRAVGDGGVQRASTVRPLRLRAP